MFPARMSSLEPAIPPLGGCSDDKSASSNPRNLKRKRADLNEQEVASKIVHIDSSIPNFVKDIPDEIVLTIFKNLKGNDLFNISR